MRSFIDNNKNTLIVVLLVSFLCSFIGFSYIVYDLNKKIEKGKEENKIMYKEYNKQLSSITEVLKGMTTIIENHDQRMNKMKITFKGKYDKGDLVNLQFTSSSDLKEDAPTVTVDDMNYIINAWVERNGQTAFLGRGQEFIDAANITGLNPIYIFAHAAVESGWGSSYLAVSRGNYFGIAAYDSNPDAAYTMGGIEDGAEWINDNFYNGRDARTLAQMKANNYATSDTWQHQISSIVNQSYRILGSTL